MRLDFSYTSNQLDNRSITAHLGGEFQKKRTLITTKAENIPTLALGHPLRAV
jgi:hypothetical protein